MTDEIMVIDEFFSPSECTAVIEEMDKLIESGLPISTGQCPPHLTMKEKTCSYICMITIMLLTVTVAIFGVHSLIAESVALPAYAQRFPFLNNKRMANLQCKLQKTVPGGGFHKWHHEAFDRAHSDRLVTWSLFLNDGFEGGETEFLYYKKRCEPRRGRLVLFPAHWGAMHRGNPPLNGTKYLATGWTLDMGHFE